MLMVEAPFGRHQAIKTLGHVYTKIKCVYIYIYSLYKLCHIHSTVSHSQFQMALLSLVSLNIQALILLADSGDVEENDSPGLRLKAVALLETADQSTANLSRSCCENMHEYARLGSIWVGLVAFLL